MYKSVGPLFSFLENCEGPLVLIDRKELFLVSEKGYYIRQTAVECSVRFDCRRFQWRIQRRGPGNLPPLPLFLNQTEARRAEKQIFGDRPPPPYLRVWITAPHPPLIRLSQGLDPALDSIEILYERSTLILIMRSMLMKGWACFQGLNVLDCFRFVF